MKLQSFHVEHVEWSHEGGRTDLLDVRTEVFVQEQGVPQTRERDELDAGSWHVLARDDAGRPIGTGRLTPEHKIGRMAVRLAWRGHGVGVALLRELLARARSLGWPEVSLSAQLGAVDFYQREGFNAYGEEYEDAGLAHQSMRLALAPNLRDAAPRRETAPLPTGSRQQIATSRLQLLRETRHQLAIYLPAFVDDSYCTDAELAELQRIATSGRGAVIRLLLHDAVGAVRDGHRLIALAQRMPSVMHIRTPLDELDLAYAASYLLTDAGGYLLLPDASRPQGRAALSDRALQAPLQRHFDDAWERSARASSLQALDL